MDGFKLSYEGIGQGIAAALTLLGVVYGIMRGNKRSDGTPPSYRPPPPNEIKAAIDALRERLDDHVELAEDERRELARQLSDLSRQQVENAKQQDRIERQLERICDRLDDDGRIGRALARLGRQPE